MLLGIKTDAPIVEFYLCDMQGNVVGNTTWEANRDLAHLLLRRLAEFVEQHETTLGDIEGLFVFRGPGSYTGLRIGITVMNTLAYANSALLVGTEGDDWLQTAIARLIAGDNDRVVVPLYGGEARITQPKK